MSMERESRALGSDAWVGAGKYQPGSELHTRATNFFKDANWGALAATASRSRAGVSCKFSEKFSVGHFNKTRRLDFDDGICWVARLRFPSTSDAEEREGLSSQSHGS